MNIPVALCKIINRAFPLPVHPFNLRNAGVKTYAEWQYEKGADTIQFFLEKYTIAGMLSGKTILDIGCGAGGKSLYYAASGASFVFGADIIPEYKEEALALAAKKGLIDRFSFILADAAALPLEDESIDVIIMNDAMEHVASPRKVLSECARVLKSEGRVFINFPPYYHPYGAHLSDLIGIPWAHLLFSRKTLASTYRELAASLPDGSRRMALRFTDRPDKNSDGSDKNTNISGSLQMTYINGMTVRHFDEILRQQTAFITEYRKNVPLRSFLLLPSRLPLLKEALTKMAVAILKKP